MASNPSIVHLPDLVLYNICSFIECPFDLLHFGNTCSRLRKISSSSSLWWSVAFRWLKGLWFFMEEGTSEENARNWFLEILRIYSKRSLNTKLECHFSNNETWIRVDSPKFRFLVNMIRLAYSRDKDDHPAVLYEQWLYDIGVYKRLESSIDFTVPNLKFTESMVHQLSALGQASERDLQRRKQPYKDPKYYIRRISSSRDSWMSDLFPENPCGSVCPLLMSPFQEAINHETSGLQGLAMCFSVVFERRLQNYYRTSFVSLQRIWEIVKVFTTVFLSEMLNLLPLFEASHDLKFIVITAVDENLYDFKQLQLILDTIDLNIKSKDVIQDLSVFLKRYNGLDFAVDDVRSHFRSALNEEIKNVLFPSDSFNSSVTRINITDSDLIGGDNSRQEMSAAAFVSDNGVLVTWHLTGRMRY
ncbi:f-box domain-containing protein [Caerostris darwini]|uniref:F-box domain-containing protein n=1 Tax=Caerostris darwini TaxID=1538125 RepID=A0AAV4PZG2_9ARAC|nr:f-box domain-containing protein [Caerostris darwini]